MFPKKLILVGIFPVFVDTFVRVSLARQCRNLITRGGSELYMRRLGEKSPSNSETCVNVRRLVPGRLRPRPSGGVGTAVGSVVPRLILLHGAGMWVGVTCQMPRRSTDADEGPQ